MNGFREKFLFPSVSKNNWFPGHMAKGLRLISRRLEYCDCLVEVHDARTTIEELKEQGETEVLYTNVRSQHHRSIKKLRSLICKVTGVDKSFIENENVLRLMVLGMPNVGKSSLINALRRTYLKKGKGASIGSIPGITKTVSYKIMVSDKPKIYLVDTPGVTMPNIQSDEVALKLATTGVLKDHLVGERLIMDYLLFMLNRNGLFEYANYCGLEKPCDDVSVVLDKTSQRIGAIRQGGVYDHTRAAQHFLMRFRSGFFGQLTFDDHLNRGH